MSICRRCASFVFFESATLPNQLTSANRMQHHRWLFICGKGGPHYIGEGMEWCLGWWKWRYGYRTVDTQKLRILVCWVKHNKPYWPLSASRTKGQGMRIMFGDKGQRSGGERGVHINLCLDWSMMWWITRQKFLCCVEISHNLVRLR